MTDTTGIDVVSPFYSAAAATAARGLLGWLNGHNRPGPTLIYSEPNGIVSLASGANVETAA